MNIENNKCIVFFVRYPAKGKVKTRLAQRIGQFHSMGLYRVFVEDMIDLLIDYDADLVVLYDDIQYQDEVKHWLGLTLEYALQQGDDIGQRMKNAFEKVFADGVQSAVLIGSDIPDLPKAIIAEAFEALNESDAVVGPSSDGGYYLIGFSKKTFAPEVFDGIPWSSETVFTDTVSVMETEGLKLHVLSRWHDIDTYEDMIALYERNCDTDFNDSASMNYIRANQLCDSRVKGSVQDG